MIIPFAIAKGKGPWSKILYKEPLDINSSSMHEQSEQYPNIVIIYGC